ncbi:MAG: SpoIIE family protein phosphatase [Bacteroidales bacterium]|nr:SpoIIE family protein phosphatase [Bacteroidales bacterium]
MEVNSVKSGLVKVSVIGLSIMVLCLVFYYIMQLRQQHAIEQISQADRAILAQKIIDVYSQQCSNIVRDNSAWDELIESYEDNIDEEWLLHNIGYMIDNYNATSVCVFDTIGRIVYQRKSPDCRSVEFYNFGGTKVPELLNGNHFIDFCQKIGDALYEYHGAAIVGVSDMITRQEKAKGYLFLVKKISDEMLSEYQRSIGNTKIGIVYSQDELASIEDENTHTYLISHDMRNYKGENVAKIYFVFENSFVGLFKHFVPIFILVSLMCIIVIIAIIRHANVKITRPLHNIAESFYTGKTDQILPLKNENNEFGVISKMMEEFFKQKDNLTRLNSDLQHSREEIMVQHETLMQQKEEITSQHENVLMLNEELKSINEDLAEQKHDLELAHQQLTSSITYASRLQSAMLQAVEPTSAMFANYCVIYQPKQLVGGDFYYTRKIDDTLVICLGDCTGHGVPGAMLASMGISFLTQLLIKNRDHQLMPDEILTQLKDKVSSSLGLDKEGEQRTDGMDIALLIYNRDTRHGYYAGARRDMVMIRAQKSITIKGDNIHIGYSNNAEQFTSKEIIFQKGDKVYLFSDGCTDQIGGPQKQRIKRHKLRTKLLEIRALPFSDQKKEIEKMIADWQGHLPQTDDITLLGFEVE